MRSVVAEVVIVVEEAAEADSDSKPVSAAAIMLVHNEREGVFMWCGFPNQATILVIGNGAPQGISGMAIDKKITLSAA